VTRAVRAAALTLALAAAARPLQAQDPDGLSVRGFGLAAVQDFSATTTFDAVFGSALQPFYGGGVSFVQSGVFLDVTVSRFSKTGERAFRSGGKSFSLGIPLTASVTPLEISAGYRFMRRRRIVPYVGAGFGKYWYKETSEFADTGENVDANHIGYLAIGGAEFRVHRLIAVAADAQYTHVPEILGQAGFSKEVNEHDLGGISGRFRVIVGR